MIRARWEDDKSQIKIYLEKKCKEIMKWAYKIPTLENNKNLSRYLITVISKKKQYQQIKNIIKTNFLKFVS